jgi:hypothetical protein
MVTTVVGALGIIAAGCLTRPVVNASPVTKTNFTTVISNQSVDKLDLLFMIDNSASMGDKQALLAKAVPDMIQRLVQPICVDAMGNPSGGNAMPDGSGCGNGKPEFPPVHNMHIGVITSSLGGRGGDICPTDPANPASRNPANTALDAHNNDQGHLIQRGGDPADPTIENIVNDATAPDNFLSWFPTVPANMGAMGPPTTPITAVNTLIADFTQIIAGVHEHGCGFEAQNESWYRFLIQPDPFTSITKDQNGHAQLGGIDDVILKQRSDFLRPDSLVAVIVVTDENEEVADPLAIGGQGWLYENTTFPGGNGPAPEGTIECKTNPYDQNCTSCGFDTTKMAPNFTQRCPADPPGGMGGYLDSSNDQINVRFFHQKPRFGVFAGYPLSRYIRGLTKPTVPNVPNEHDGNGNYIGDQDGQANCVNPLFAENLPADHTTEWCQLTRGPRTPDLIYYAAIAGVPHELLQAKPGELAPGATVPDCPAGTNPADCPQKSRLTTGDWTLITGNDAAVIAGTQPENYDFTGADFHMVESEVPRTMNTGNWANASTCPPGNPMGANCDPINGSEWDPQKGDLQLACRFDIRPQYGGVGKDCTSTKYTGSCDCAAGNRLLNNTLCDTATPTLQIYGKAYPSVRELEIAHAMSLQNAMAGGQGIVSSLCPIHVTDMAGGNDPLYGYRPAVNAIVNRLKTALSAQCVPQKLAADPTCGNFPCLVLVSLTKDVSPTGDTTLCKNPGMACSVAGLSPPDPAAGQVDVVSRFCDAQEAAWKANHNGPGPDPLTVPVCVMTQLYQAAPGAPNTCSPPPAAAGTFNNGSCAASTADQGWCYVTGAAAGGCGHSILFTSSMPPAGSTVSLQCIEQAVTAIDAGGG